MSQISLTLLTALVLMSAASVNAQNATDRSQSANLEHGAATSSSDHSGASPAAPPPAARNPKPVEPVASGAPHTEMLPGNSLPDSLLDLKPLPRANLSLIGGIARKVDVVHNRVTVQPFGGGDKYLIYFDERTHFLSSGRETTVLEIHPGDRVYVDTQAMDGRVFARSIQVRSTGGAAEASGQVIEMLGRQVRMLDRSTGETVRFAINDRTKVESQGAPTSVEELRSGLLIAVRFTPDGRRSVAQSITIYASPGQSYNFSGILTHVDLRDGLLSLNNKGDGNDYELYFDPLNEKDAGRLVEGTTVSISANFDGKRYRATSIKVTEPMTVSSDR